MHAGLIFSEGGRTYDLIFPIINSPFNSCNFLAPQAMTCTFHDSYIIVGLVPPTVIF